MQKAVLYLSHDGMLEPLGESQVLAYLERIAAKNAYSIHLISFEKKRDRADATRFLAMERRMESAGIHWHPLTYHSWPPLVSTLYDLATAFFRARSLHRVRSFSLIHARSYPMALVALGLRRFAGIPFIFDMRGFWADERAEAGSWRRSALPYRFFKGVERRALLEAAAVVSLTEAAVRVIERFPYLKDVRKRFQVIPTCADLSLFQVEPVPQGRFTLGYVGSTALWYNFAPVAKVFRILRELRPDSRLLVLTRDPQEPILEMLKEFPTGSLEIRSASRSETAAAIRRMHFTAFFLHSSFAKTASMPTKLAEFLGSGVPCLTNVGCGDLEAFFARFPAGKAVRNVEDEEELRQAVGEVVALSEKNEARLRCRAIAEENLGLEAGVNSYLQLYREVVGS